MAAPLPFPDELHLRGARGWLELGNPREAEADLGLIRPDLQMLPEVLEVRFQAVVGQKRFAEGLEIARRQIRTDAADHRGHMNTGNALFWLGEAGEAADVVTAVVEKFPEISALPYNLACYCVRMGRLDEARAWLQQSLEIGRRMEEKMGPGRRENIIAYGLCDPDLRELWDYLKEMSDSTDEAGEEDDTLGSGTDE